MPASAGTSDAEPSASHATHLAVHRGYHVSHVLGEQWPEALPSMIAACSLALPHGSAGDDSYVPCTRLLRHTSFDESGGMGLLLDTDGLGNTLLRAISTASRPLSDFSACSSVGDRCVILPLLTADLVVTRRVGLSRGGRLAGVYLGARRSHLG